MLQLILKAFLDYLPWLASIRVSPKVFELAIQGFLLDISQRKQIVNAIGNAVPQLLRQRNALGSVQTHRIIEYGFRRHAVIISPARKLAQKPAKS